MGIWLVKREIGFRSLTATSEKDGRDLADRFNRKLIGETWSSIRTRLSLDDEPWMKLGDFMRFPPSSSVLTCNARALEVIKPVIKDEVEILPLLSDDGDFCILNPINVMDCLDYQLSDIEYWKDGTIWMIKKKIFRAGCSQASKIFKIPERPFTDVYVTDEFKTVVEANGLTGLTFERIEEQ